MFCVLWVSLFLLGGIMENLFIFLITFVSIFLIYFFVFYLKGLKKKKIKKSMQVQLILTKTHLKEKDINEKSIGIIICLIDALIISSAGTIATSINVNYVWQILIGFALLMGLIYSLYTIVGIILKRKCNKK